VECKRILAANPFNHIHSEDDGDGKDNEAAAPSITDYRLWLAAISAIVIISLCGIFGVLVIPIMQKVFYQHLIQFLVALAIGSMLGDALLHLIPHALAPGSAGKYKS
jgi:zinc transporter ZupT